MSTHIVLTYSELASDAYRTNLVEGRSISGGFSVTSVSSNPDTGFNAFSAYNQTTNTLAIGFAGTDSNFPGMIPDLVADLQMTGLSRMFASPYMAGPTTEVGNPITNQDAQAIAFTQGAITAHRMMSINGSCHIPSGRREIRVRHSGSH